MTNQIPNVSMLATDECIAQGKLTDILSKNRREVIDMLLTSLDEEK